MAGPYIIGKASMSVIDSCAPEFKVICLELIKLYDFKATDGYRSPQEQYALWEQGRTKLGRIVTKVDGIRTKSKHNYNPSKAIDIYPFPLDWGNKSYRDKQLHLGGLFLGIAHMKNIKIRWGNDWNMDDDFKDGWDLPHFELLNP